MRFERGTDPRHSMDIGIEKEILHPERIAIKFRINKEDSSNTKPIDRRDYAELLEMWAKGSFNSKRLIRILSLRGFWKAITTVTVEEINIKIPFNRQNDDGDLTIFPNMISSKMGKGEKIFVRYGGKNYALPVKSVVKMLSM